MKFTKLEIVNKASIEIQLMMINVLKYASSTQYESEI